MNRLLIVVLASLLVLTGVKTLPTEEPAEEQEVTISASEWLPLTPTEDLWVLAKQYAMVIVQIPGCRNLLYSLTGQDPVLMITESRFRVSIPERWPSYYDEYAALTTCMPPRVAIRRGFVDIEDTLSVALVLVHEMAHVGTCGRVMDGEIPEEAWEDMASRVDQYCMAELADGEW
jgi:hypothetical protein